MGGARHSKVQPILCYRNGSVTPSSVRKIGTRCTICHNYPAVGIAPHYLIMHNKHGCFIPLAHACGITKYHNANFFSYANSNKISNFFQTSNTLRPYKITNLILIPACTSRLQKFLLRMRDDNPYTKYLKNRLQLCSRIG